MLVARLQTRNLPLPYQFLQQLNRMSCIQNVVLSDELHILRSILQENFC